MNYLSKLMYFALLAALLNASAATAATNPKAAKAGAAKETPTAAATDNKDAKEAPAAATPAPASSQPPQAISFNRLMRVTPRRHLPPMEDGLRDPANADTATLQPPMEVFSVLPQTPSGLGNGVNWVGALNGGKIKPRWELKDPTAEAMVMDMSVVRVPKGTMPDVVFPHKQHTEWLDCSNCHPDVFVPQQGANQISMAAIILGQKCGLCHGKVAFPVSECTRCHSQPKQAAVAKAKAGAKP